MTANECYRPSVDAQLRYTVQWFLEWSEMQRDDFLPILTQKFAPASYVNGLISGVDSLGFGEGRPPSLFQCRAKLFREWVDGWSQTERDQLLSQIKSMDPGFHARVQEGLGAPNGDIKHSEEQESPTEEQVKSPIEAPVEVEPQEVLPDVIVPVVNSNSVHEDDVQSDPEVEPESIESEPAEPGVDKEDSSDIE